MKEIYDYEFVKKCYKCGIILLKSNFQKNKTKYVGLNSNCKVCRKQCYNENLVKTKNSYLDNRD